MPIDLSHDTATTRTRAHRPSGHPAARVAYPVRPRQARQASQGRPTPFSAQTRWIQGVCRCGPAWPAKRRRSSTDAWGLTCALRGSSPAQASLCPSVCLWLAMGARRVIAESSESPSPRQRGAYHEPWPPPGPSRPTAPGTRPTTRAKCRPRSRNTQLAREGSVCGARARQDKTCLAGPGSSADSSTSQPPSLLKTTTTTTLANHPFARECPSSPTPPSPGSAEPTR